MYKSKINFKSWVKRTKEKFEDTKGVPDGVNRRKTENAIVMRKIIKGQIMIHKTLHRKLMIEQHQSY